MLHTDKNNGAKIRAEPLTSQLVAAAHKSGINTHTMDQHSPAIADDPTLGMVNVDAITESIQNCHMTVEESRRILQPMMKILLDDDDEDELPNHEEEDYSDDESIVQAFMECIDRTFGSVDMLMIRLADGGLIPPPVVVQNHSNGGGSSMHQQQQQDYDNVYLLMASNCISKACEFIGHHVLTLLEGDSMDDSSSGPLDDHNASCFIQPTMGRLCELALRVYTIQHAMLITTTTSPSNHNNNDNDDEEEEITPQTIIKAYTQYQRRCLRTRSKPAISSVAELRRVASSQEGCFVSDLLDAEKRQRQLQLEEVGIDIDDDIEDENCHDIGNNDTDNNATRGQRQPHAEALTIVLGEASSLLQPLAAWRDALLIPQQQQCAANNGNNNDDDGSSSDDILCSLLQQLCQESIELLDTEAQTLASTVGSWFTSDQRGVATLDHHDDDINNNNNNNNDNDATTKSDLLSIEASLEEMAFLCQVISRYCLFSKQILAPRDSSGSGICSSDISGRKDETKLLQDLLTEQSLHYSTLETRLATLQFNQAISLASPQLIELGRHALQVPSIVEDAHFVCVRAIERASGTRSERAVWTVGHWVCELWGIDQGGSSMGSGGGGDDGDGGGIKGVYRALMEGVGCTAGESDNDDVNNTTQTSEDNMTRPSPSKVENAFAAALLEAVDDDNGGEKVDKKSHNPPGSAPASGGLTSFFAGRGGHGGQSLQSRIDAELCALNGISAAETACTALSGLFADLVEEKLQEETAGIDNANDESSTQSKPSSMLTFARDELASHTRSYHTLLKQRVRSLVVDLCGGDDLFDCDGQLCLQNLRLFIEKEVYSLDGASFRTLEGEDRLETEMIGPIRQSQIFDEISKDKCDTVVVLQMAEAMSWKSAEIILQVLLQGKTNFNEWGALLLSKQVRMLQNLYCGLVLLDSDGSTTGGGATLATILGTTSTVSILTQFERVNQAVSILQLEKPSDWLAFSYKVGESNETNLTTDEIQTIMSLRTDFSEEAIARVCIHIGGG